MAQDTTIEHDETTYDEEAPATEPQRSTVDRDEFARTHSEQAVKQAATGPAQTQTAEQAKAFEDTKDLSADEATAQIAELEAKLPALRARQAQTTIQEYPKVLYHDDHEHEDESKRVAPVTVRSKDEEDDAKGHGWGHANPGEAAKARGSKTPDATEHTREDENVRRDLPAQMAVDQDARTGKPPIDRVMGDSEAPDPGAPAPPGTTGGGQPAAPTRPAPAKPSTTTTKQPEPPKKGGR